MCVMKLPVLFVEQSGNFTGGPSHVRPPLLCSGTRKTFGLLNNSGSHNFLYDISNNRVNELDNLRGNSPQSGMHCFRYWLLSPEEADRYITIDRSNIAL